VPNADSVLVAAPYPALRDRLSGLSLVDPAGAQALSPEARAGVRVIVANAFSPLTGEQMDLYPRLGLIVCVGAGSDQVDARAAEARGVRIATGAGANAADVADMALGLLIAATRGILANDRRVREGEWRPRELRPCRSISALSVGIAGLGSIGRSLAARLAPLGCRVAWTGPRPKPDVDLAYYPDLLSLARDADVLVLAMPLGPQTAGAFGREVLDALGPEGVLVNVGRGGLVDEDELIAALREGRLGGAALDVFAKEPTPAERWRDVPNVILSPHTAAVTHQAMDAVWDLAAKHVREFLATTAGPA